MHAFGQARDASFVDQLGVRLSGLRMRRHLGGFAGKRVADIGCGYQATLARPILDDAARVVLLDLALAPDLASHPKVETIEGLLPDAMAGIETGSLDAVLCINVVEHLWEPLETLRHVRRVLAPGGAAFINVPSWRGKRFLEFSAFRLGLSPAEEMDDHKTYYDPRDLWPLLVQAGFRPRGIRCSTHKLGLNTFAVCRVGRDGPGGRSS